MSLALFDTDKTLLDVSTLVERAFSEATNRAVGQRFKFAHLKPHEYAGVDMEAIFRTWLERRFQYLPKELSRVSRQHWREVEKNYYDNLEGLLETQGRREKYLVTGIKEFLTLLHEQDIPCGVYSGAPIRIHRLSLESLELDKYFQVRVSHGYANIKTRPGLIQYCHTHMEHQLGKNIPKSRVVAFGDSPKDALAARQYGIRCAIILEKSSSPLEDIKAASPDYIFDSFEKGEKIIDTVFLR